MLPVVTLTNQVNGYDLRNVKLPSPNPYPDRFTKHHTYEPS